MRQRIPGKRRPRTVRCKGCKEKIKVKSKGRVPTYCGQACKQLAYLKRRIDGPTLLMARDIATAKVRDAIRQEIWAVLLQVGLVTGKPPPPPKPQREKPKLRLITREPDNETS